MESDDITTDADVETTKEENEIDETVNSDPKIEETTEVEETSEQLNDENKDDIDGDLDEDLTDVLIDGLPTETEEIDNIGETTADIEHEEGDEITATEEIEGMERSNTLDAELAAQKELEEELWKLEKNPFYLPRSDFPTLPEEYDIDQLPRSYQENTVREETCLQFADNFCRQFRLLYGDRKPLYLTPINEAGIRKMLCTTLQVAHPEHSKLLQWEGAAELVAKALVPVPLLPCTEPPKRLLAPTTALGLRAGTSFEAASLLVCLLLGVGYNAYVVQGYATREVCLVDQTRFDCPPDDEKISQMEQDEQPTKEVHSKKEKRKRYPIRPPKDLRSKFELEQAARKKRAEEERIQKIIQEREEEERIAEEVRNDPLYGQRVHAWVLVLAGKREVAENFFIEPFTGKSVSIETTNQYLGIEAIWNHKNYFVNMQPTMHGLSGLNFDLNNTSFWEYLLPGQESSIVQPITDNINDTIGDGDNIDEHTKSSKEKYFEMPKTWTKRIVIDLADYQNDYQTRPYEIVYRKARAEYYPPYMMNDGLTIKIRRYEDRLLKKLLKIIEKFTNRRDKLLTRITNPNDGLKSEYFNFGRKSHLKEHHIYTSFNMEPNQIMRFYYKSRVDHLKEIQESKTKMITYYENRPDYLKQQIVIFGDETKKKFGPANSRESIRPYETIKELYNRNLTIPAYKDIQEITYFLKEERIQIYFHPDKENISGDIIKFQKQSTVADARRGSTVLLDRDELNYYQVDPYRPKMTEVELYQYFKYILSREEASINMSRQIEMEIKTILDLRSKETISNDLDVALYNRVKNDKARQKRIADEEAIEKDKARIKDEELDYLEPFLLRLDIDPKNPKDISKELAKKLYDYCVIDFKERGINKANILQKRYESETDEMQKNQDWYQKNQLNMRKEDEENYTQKTSEIGFRVTTLEKMISRHKQMLEKKESILKDKLKTDPRLSSLFH